MRFASIELDVARRELRNDGCPVVVEPLVFDFLAYLARHPDRVVSREELTRQLWRGTAVSYWALARVVKEARHAIGDTGRSERLLETVRGRGFRLATRVEVPAPPARSADGSASLPGVESSLEFARRAAAHAADRGAWAEAAHHLRSALKLRGEGDLELVVSLGETLVRACDLEEGRALLRRAAARAGSAERPDLLARAALAYCGAEESPVPDPERIALLESALAGLPEGAGEERIRVLARLARATCMGVEARRREVLARQVLDEARATGRDDLTCEALAAAHLGCWTPDNLEQREAWAREQVALAARLGDPLRVHDARMDLVSDLLERGDRAGVNLLLEQHQRTAARRPNLLLEWHAAHYACLRAMLEGRLDDAEQCLARAHALGRQAGYEISGAWHGVQLVTLAWKRHRLDELAPAVETFAAAHPIPIWEVAAALAAAEAGRLEPAREAIRRSLCGDRVALPRDFTWLLAACLLLEVCRRAGDPAGERATRRALQPYADRQASLHAMASWGPVSGFLAGPSV